MKPILIYSTPAIDRYFDSTGKFVKKSDGGPASFIVNVLKSQNMKFKTFLTQKGVVDITVTKSGEYGRVIKKPKSKTISQKASRDSYLLVSTLFDEWILKPSQASIFLDIQGYVRDVRNLGRYKQFGLPASVQSSVECIKATEEELQFFDQTCINKQKQKQLVVSTGENGTDLYFRGRKYNIPCRAVRNLPNTVGAGDTWLTAYLISQVKGLGFLEAARQATAYTRVFLLSKKEQS